MEHQALGETCRPCPTCVLLSSALVWQRLWVVRCGIRFIISCRLAPFGPNFIYPRCLSLRSRGRDCRQIPHKCVPYTKDGRRVQLLCKTVAGHESVSSAHTVACEKMLRSLSPCWSLYISPAILCSFPGKRTTTNAPSHLGSVCRTAARHLVRCAVPITPGKHRRESTRLIKMIEYLTHASIPSSENLGYQNLAGILYLPY